MAKRNPLKTEGITKASGHGQTRQLVRNRKLLLRRDRVGERMEHRHSAARRRPRVRRQPFSRQELRHHDRVSRHPPLSEAQTRHAPHTLTNGEKITARVCPWNDGKPGTSLIELKTTDGMVIGFGGKTYGELMKN
jgi:hypothetical protein